MENNDTSVSRGDDGLQALRDWQPPIPPSVASLLGGIDERLLRYPMEDWLKRITNELLQYANGVNSSFDMLVAIGTVSRLWKPASKEERNRITSAMQHGESFVFPTDVVRAWFVGIDVEVRRSFELFTLLRFDDLFRFRRDFPFVSSED